MPQLLLEDVWIFKVPNAAILYLNVSPELKMSYIDQAIISPFREAKTHRMVTRLQFLDYLDFIRSARNVL